MTKALEERAAAIVDQTIQSDARRLSDALGWMATPAAANIAALDVLICATQEAARRVGDEPVQTLMEALGLGLDLRNKASWITADDMDELGGYADALVTIASEIAAEWQEYADGYSEEELS